MSKKLKQISIFIENSPGRLFEVTQTLGAAGINLMALSLADSGDFGVLRLLVSDVATARRIIMKKNLPARVDEVIAAEIADHPGSLASVLKPLLEAKVNISYMYSSIGFSSGKAIVIFKFNDNEKGIAVLEQQEIRLLNAHALGILEKASGKHK